MRDMKSTGGWGRISLVAMMVSGCALAGPSSGNVRQLQDRVDALNQRITQLEYTRGGTGYVPPQSSGVLADENASTQSNSTASSGSYGSSSAMGDAFTKFFRGGVNLITGWVEIPKRVTETSQQSGMAVGLTWGLLRGLGYGCIRTAAGLYELVTFPVAAPPGYRPVMEPPFVFE